MGSIRGGLRIHTQPAWCSAPPVCGLASVLRLGRAGPSPFYQVPVHQGRVLPTLAAVRGSQAKLGAICEVTVPGWPEPDWDASSRTRQHRVPSLFLFLLRGCCENCMNLWVFEENTNLLAICVRRGRMPIIDTNQWIYISMCILSPPLEVLSEEISQIKFNWTR